MDCANVREGHSVSDAPKPAISKAQCRRLRDMIDFRCTDRTAVVRYHKKANLLSKFTRAESQARGVNLRLCLCRQPTNHGASGIGTSPGSGTTEPTAFPNVS